MSTEHVHEEIQLLANDFSTMFMETLAYVPRWRDYYLAHDQTSTYEYLATQLKAKENAMNQELSSLDRSNQKKVDAWRQKGNAMTQAEGEQAQQDYARMQQEFQARKQQLEQELYKTSEDLKTQIRKKVEEYLKDFNNQGKYSFIFSYDPSSFIYYKDSIYNITSDMVDGLNADYKKKN